MKTLNLLITRCDECPYYEEGMAGYSDDWCHKRDSEVFDGGLIADECTLAEVKVNRSVDK
jgi:hypothetical protein